MKASSSVASSASLHHHATSNVHHAQAHYPWLTTVCVLFGLGIVALAVFWIRRCKSNVPRHEYTAVNLENSSGLHYLQAPIDDRPPRHQNDDDLKKYQCHLGPDSRYFFTGGLGKIGARPNKLWFVVKDKHLDAERLLTLVDLPSTASIKPNPTTQQVLMELFRSLHHPYVLPILDIEFWELVHSAGAVIVSPLSNSGSLRDLIYCGIDFEDSYERKYQGRGRGLPYRQIQYLTRQILEALAFLRARNFPTFHHLHSGNVIIQNGVARLAGLENTMFCLQPTRKSACDEVFAFGHLLFEMTTGYEPSDALLTSPTVLQRELDRSAVPDQIADVLALIFDTYPSGEPLTIEDVVRQEMFKGVELRELCRRTSPALNLTMSPGVDDLLQLFSDRDKSSTPQSTESASSVTAPATAGGASADYFRTGCIYEEIASDRKSRRKCLFLSHSTPCSTPKKAITISNYNDSMHYKYKDVEDWKQDEDRRRARVVYDEASMSSLLSNLIQQIFRPEDDGSTSTISQIKRYSGKLISLAENFLFDKIINHALK